MTGKRAMPMDQFRRAPFPSEDEVEFGREDVVWFGKVSYYGDARTLYVVRLRGGDERDLVFVKAVDQPKEDEKWLRSVAKMVNARAASRDGGFSLVGISVDDGGSGTGRHRYQG